MANIADNLTRLLGTTGYNIQEILENTDSLGGGSSSLNIPMIEFVMTADGPSEVAVSIGEVKNIDDVNDYVGMCIIVYTIPNYGSIKFIGNASEDVRGGVRTTHYSALGFVQETITCTVFSVTNNEVTVSEYIFEPASN